MHTLWLEIDLAQVGDDVRQIADEVVERAVEASVAEPLWVRSGSDLLAVLTFDSEERARGAADRFVVGQQLGEPQGGATLASVRVGTLLDRRAAPG